MAGCGAVKMLLAVALGGAIGAVARWYSVGQLTRWLGTGFPYGILLVNVTGSFLMGVVVEYLSVRAGASAELRGFLAVGVLGAFTTFSSFALDVRTLLERDEILPAMVYVSASVLASVLALFAGIAAARSLG